MPAGAFGPTRVTQTIKAMEDAQNNNDQQALATHAAEQTLRECEVKLARYRAALEAGTDPALITKWTAEVNAEKAAALVRRRAAGGRPRMTRDEIATLVHTLGDILSVLHHADPQDKADVYARLALRLTYQPGQHSVVAEATPESIMYVTECPRGDSNLSPMPVVVRGTISAATGRAPRVTVRTPRAAEPAVGPGGRAQSWMAPVSRRTG